MGARWTQGKGDGNRSLPPRGKAQYYRNPAKGILIGELAGNPWGTEIGVLVYPWGTKIGPLGNLWGTAGEPVGNLRGTWGKNRHFFEEI